MFDLFLRLIDFIAEMLIAFVMSPALCITLLMAGIMIPAIGLYRDWKRGELKFNKN